MDSATNTVLGFVYQSLQNNQPCWLITVVKTWGSAPRLPGACLAWNVRQGSCGSLSGGCIEEDLLHRLAAGEFDHHSEPFFQHYGINADDAYRFGLPCGGKLELLMEYLPADDHHRQHFCQIKNAIDKRNGITRKIALHKRFDDPERAKLEPARPHPLQRNADYVGCYIGPGYRLLIIGANQVAQYLTEFCQTLDFDIWVCDPREQAFAQWPSEFAKTFSVMPDDLIREHARDKHTAIVAVAHDPRVDDMALMEALTTDCFYIGAMGSTKSSSARKSRLQELGITRSQLARLVAPVGLDIGSKTPAEIALAIAADLVRAVRRV